MHARERAVDEHLGPPVRAVAAEEDRAARPVRGHRDRALERRDAVLRDQAVVDHVPGDARRRRLVGGAPVPGERPAVEAPGAAEVEALGRRRQLAQASGDVARVHDDLGGRRPVTGGDRDAPCRPRPRLSWSGTRNSPVASVDTSIVPASPVTRTCAPGTPDQSGAPTVPMRPPRESPTTVSACAGGRDENSRSSDTTTSGPVDPLHGHVQRPVRVRRRRHADPDDRDGARRELGRRVQLQAA